MHLERAYCVWSILWLYKACVLSFFLELLPGLIPFAMANFRENHWNEYELKLSYYIILKYFHPTYMYFWYYLHLLFFLTLKSS